MSFILVASQACRAVCGSRQDQRHLPGATLFSLHSKPHQSPPWISPTDTQLVLQGMTNLPDLSTNNTIIVSLTPYSVLYTSRYEIACCRFVMYTSIHRKNFSKHTPGSSQGPTSSHLCWCHCVNMIISKLILRYLGVREWRIPDAREVAGGLVCAPREFQE